MKDDSSENKVYRGYWKNPITYISLFLLLMVILLIAANVLGFDKGEMLIKLAAPDFARGLITYLFAVGTIGVIIVITLAILLGSESFDERIKRAKDILSILIGLFGTIIGFYFGSQISGREQQNIPSLQISPIQVTDTLAAGNQFNVRTMIYGGDPPYTYWMILDSVLMKGETEDIINTNLAFPGNSRNYTLELIVKDKKGNRAYSEKKIEQEE